MCTRWLTTCLTDTSAVHAKLGYGATGQDKEFFMALPSATTAATIASLTLLSFCGWGPGGGGGGPGGGAGGGPIVAPAPGWETAEWRETGVDWDTDTEDWDSEPDTEFDSDNDSDSDADGDSDTDTDSDTTLTTGVVRSSITASEIAVSESNTCAITGGLVTCWGDDRFGVVSNVPTTPVRNIAMGWDFACAISISDGSVVCWGDNTFGTTTDAPVGEFESVSAGTAHACANTSTGGVACWGSDSFGKATAPTGVSLFDVNAGDQHSCALTSQGDRQCWGDTGVWSLLREGPFASVDAGQSTSCMQDNTGVVPSVVCDGDYSEAGQIMADQFDLGRTGVLCSVFGGDISCLGTLVDPPPGSDADLFQEVVVGGTHFCARSQMDSVTCWGTSERGALGLPAAE